MATATAPSQDRLAPAAQFDVTKMTGGFFRMLASLKLTVGLFVLGLIIIYAGTMAQYKMGIWDVVKLYFRSFIVWIPFDILFPPHWFPRLQGITGGFWFPGGKALGIALLVNLTSAHVIRFKIQANGTRLFLGGVLTFVGLGIISLIVIQASVRNGVQDKPWIPMEAIWYAVLIGMFALVIAMVASIFTIGSGKAVEKGLLVIGITVIGGLLIWLFSTGRTLDSSALRILWQLIQALIASLVTLAGCILIFKKRAGIVILHAGIALLMVNELYVGMTNVEERISLYEGQETNIAEDTRTVELSITDRSGSENDKVIAIPRDQLNSESIIDHEELPFRIRIDYFTRNSDLIENPRGEAQELRYKGIKKKLKPTTGGGMGYSIQPLDPVPGAEGNKTDLASAYISIVPKGGSDAVDTLMLSQHFNWFRPTLPDDGEFSQKIIFEGTEYEIDLRYKRAYKPYFIKLLDVAKEDYVGTDVPQSYWSKFEVKQRRASGSKITNRSFAEEKKDSNIDVLANKSAKDIAEGEKEKEPGDELASNEDSEFTIMPAKIEMNNPLRYQGETFYQSGYNKVQGRELSTLQVVTNRGWMIPYLCCVIVGLGMVAQFSTVLFRFINKLNNPTTVGLNPQKARRLREEEARISGSTEDDFSDVELDTGKKKNWVQILWPVAAAVAIVLVVAGGLRSRASSPMDLAKAGKIPMAYEGRVLPLDSFARNTLRSIYENEEIKYRAEDRTRTPAIQWLFDVATNSNDVNEVHLFRIYNKEVRQELDLPERKRYRYSMVEIEEKLPSFQEKVDQAAKMDKNERKPFELAILELASKVRQYRLVQRYLMLPTGADEVDPNLPKDAPPQSAEEKLLTYALNAMVVASDQTNVPLLVPTMINKENWETLTVAAAREVVSKLASEKKLDSPRELAVYAFEKMLGTEQEQFDRKLRMAVLSELQTQVQMFAKRENRELSREQLEQLVLSVYRSDERPRFEERVAPTVRQEIASQKLRMIQGFELVNGGDKFSTEKNKATDLIRDVFTAYKSANVEGFNTSVDEYHEYTKTIEPTGLDTNKIRVEYSYNQAAPLFAAIVLYFLGAIFSVMGWMVWPKQLGRLSFFIIFFAVLIHSAALMIRMYVSGRPPVTNLYSSAVFIGWSSAIIGLIIERTSKLGIGNVIGGTIGCVTLVIARFLALDEDTFKVVQAVLDTQFWLATHVVCITLGYATTYVAGFLGLLFVVLGLSTKSLDKSNRAALGRMIYGVTCFSILFSFVGTVLGGLWADDSWGRFWGWDPKENGAMLIVVWNALILHARWGGMVRDRGLALLAIGGNIITSFSWFGVNQLGVGLHSYGFNASVLNYLFYSVMFFTAFIIIGLLPTEIWRSYNAEKKTT